MDLTILFSTTKDWMRSDPQSLLRPCAYFSWIKINFLIAQKATFSPYNNFTGNITDYNIIMAFVYALYTVSDIFSHPLLYLSCAKATL